MSVHLKNPQLKSFFTHKKEDNLKMLELELFPRREKPGHENLELLLIHNTYIWLRAHTCAHTQKHTYRELNSASLWDWSQMISGNFFQAI